jgi:hypothetical protein
MSKENYIKWQTAADAHLSKIDRWLGDEPYHEVWGAINQYLPRNISDEESHKYQQFKATTLYLDESDGIELTLGEGKPESGSGQEDTQWGDKLSVLAGQVIFQLTDDENKLEAKARDGSKIEDLIDQPLGFTLKKWTIEYRADNEFNNKDYLGGVSVMVWKRISTGSESTLSWQYIPYE